MTEVFLGIDIGGSHIGVGCVSAGDGNLLCSFSSPIYAYSTFEELLELIVETVLAMIAVEDKDNCSKLDIISIGIGCPGQCKDGILVGACIFRKHFTPLKIYTKLT
jgi:predicted NBD/HSP70 family sugar kinase